MTKSLIFLAFLTGMVLCGCATNPITGQREFMLFSEEQDIQLGQKYAPELEKQSGGRIPDTQLQRYINEVGERVAAVSDNPNFDYNFIAVNDDGVNAFALPGGYIFITKGLLKNLRTEAQLAGILAHEVTHVVARDTSRMMSREVGLEILLTASLGEASPGVQTVAGITRQITSLSYSREAERTADLGGLEYMVKAGYNPFGLVEAMQTFERGGGIEFLSTHPSPENRVQSLRDTIRKRGYPTAALKTGEEEYRLNVTSRLN